MPNCRRPELLAPGDASLTQALERPVPAREQALTCSPARAAEACSAVYAQLPVGAR